MYNTKALIFTGDYFCPIAYNSINLRVSGHPMNDRANIKQTEK